MMLCVLLWKIAKRLISISNPLNSVDHWASMPRISDRIVRLTLPFTSAPIAHGYHHPRYPPAA